VSASSRSTGGGEVIITLPTLERSVG
jgi:hypothetical protein